MRGEPFNAQSDQQFKSLYNVTQNQGLSGQEGKMVANTTYEQPLGAYSN